MTPISFIPLDDIEAVDLTRHALIEASAGTGKTYTIENLVVRLLKTEPDLALENILLVTFTEKAVSELKLRIRQRIEAELVSEKTLPADVHKKLEACLDNFDTAAIFTIHGFCYTLLREFPFETGSLFEQEPVDDGPLMEKWLRRQIRDQWPQRYGRHLDILLHVSGFSAGPENFIRTIIKIARQLTGDPAEERIVPASPDQDAASLWQSILSAVSALTSLMGDPNADLADQYNHLNIHASTRKSIISKVIVPVQAALADILPEEDPSIDAVSCLNDVLEAASDRLSSLVPEKWLKAGENLSVCPNLHAIQDHLVHLHQTFLLLSHLLQQDAINTLRADVEAEKAANGWISYQDMLSRVAAFVQKSDAGAGIDAIRNRYRIAFVDEFQDTDSVQWRIFKTLFLEGGNTRFGNRLFLIGDPKQAIYGFRGADVFTYLSARQEMIRLADRGEASLYSLSTNWRSLPDLVTAFNFLFSTPAWFGPGPPADPFAIGYMTAASPPPDMLPMTLAGDPASSLPLVVADLSDHPDTSAARTALASFICQEIRHLVEASDVHIADTNGKTRKPTFGDMAILVRTQNEFLRLEPALCAWNIPFAYYRQPGLFQSVQAHFLSMVLRAISRPQDPRLLKTALLTPFFDIPPPSLVNLADIPADHPIRRLMRHWVYLAARRNWGALFQSLMADSGLCLRHCLDPDWERMETNFQQIFDHLMVSAHIKNLDLGGMAALLDRLREDDANPDPDADIHQIADEGDKVRILTLHVSKGLEFPIVFVAGGLSVKGPEKIRVYHEKNPDPAVSGFRKIIDLSGAINPEAADKESADEDRRLFYVALTRARLRL
ncbi:UvrD-helicase domain-containing protein, partial [Desulfosarcina sp. OttesenSCG-928-G10]|nr:UvrD-helicase domain-containing protein [Desulfosarcina sp. OttesenSCG-928-G10]